MQVYCIENKINGKLYIGKDQKSNPEYYGSGTLIKLALKKYGIDNFEKKILEEVDDKILLCERERHWIDKLNSLSPNGYNIQLGGINTDTMTNHPDKEKIYKQRTLNNPDMYNNRGGWKMSDEGKRNISKSNKSGEKWVRDKISNTLQNNNCATKYRIIKDTDTNITYKFEGLNTMNDFIDEYNITENISYHSRINKCKLRRFNKDKNFIVLETGGIHNE